MSQQGWAAKFWPSVLASASLSHHPVLAVDLRLLAAESPANSKLSVLAWKYDKQSSRPLKDKTHTMVNHAKTNIELIEIWVEHTWLKCWKRLAIIQQRRIVPRGPWSQWSMLIILVAYDRPPSSDTIAIIPKNALTRRCPDTAGQLYTCNKRGETCFGA